MQTLTMTFDRLLRYEVEKRKVVKATVMEQEDCPNLPIYNHVPIHYRDSQWLVPCLQMDDNEHLCTMDWQQSGPIISS
jgi:hypothetical protein